MKNATTTPGKIRASRARLTLRTTPIQMNGSVHSSSQILSPVVNWPTFAEWTLMSGSR